MQVLHQQGIEKCPYCNKKFLIGSEIYYAHLLFSHGFYIEPCKSRRAKILEKQAMLGFTLRRTAQIMKGKYQRTLRYKRCALWGRAGLIKKFFGMIENGNMGITNVH